MKKVLVLLLVLVSFVSYGQRYVSRKQHINTINNEYVLGQSNIYFTIEGNKILNTDRKGIKVFDEYTIGETKKGDEIIKYSVEVNNDKKILLRKSMDMFTNKSSKLIYELTLID
jgi:hypothetical protein